MAAMSFNRIKLAAKSETYTHKKIFIIMQILLAIGAAVYGIGMETDSIGINDRIYVYPSGLGCFLFLTAAFCGFIAVINLFKDMHNVQTADVQLSMPLSARERYHSKLLSLFWIQILPMIAYSVIGGLLAVLLNDLSGDVLEHITASFLLLMNIALFTDAVTIFCCCCCGTFAESIYTSLITLTCLSLLPYAFFSVIVEQFAGVQCNTTDVYFGYWTYSGIMSFDEELSALCVRSNLISWAISIAVIFVTQLIYTRRDAKTVGKSVVFPAFFEMFMFLGLMTIFIFFWNDSQITIGLILSLIVYFVIRIIITRAKIKAADILIWLGKYLVSLCIYVAIAAVGYATDGFGYRGYAPPKEYLDGSSIHISIFDYSNCDDYFDNYPAYDWDSYELSAEEAAEISDLFREYNTYDEKSLSDFLGWLSGGDADNELGKVYVTIYIISDSDYYDKTHFSYRLSYLTDIESAQKIMDVLDSNRQLEKTVFNQ